MRRTIAAVCGGLALLGLPSCEANGGRMIEQESKKEWIVLAIYADKDNRCKLREKTPGEVRTDGGSSVTWIVAGDCPGDHRIAINRRVHQGANQVELFAGSEPIQTQARDGSRMSARLKPADQIQKGHYRYLVEIDDRPAEFNPRADRGSLLACPTWPCGKFDDY